MAHDENQLPLPTNSPSNELPGILRLSSELRLRIYRKLEGWGWGPHSCRYALDLSTPEPPGTLAEKDYYNSHLTVNMRRKQFLRSLQPLLFSCRTLYTELAHIIYSVEWFVCYYKGPGSLAQLQSLTPSSVASLTNLKIVLNNASCHSQEGWGMCSVTPPMYQIYFPPRDEDQLASPAPGADLDYDAPLSLSNSSAADMLAEWEKVAGYLGSHVTPGELELSLVCDVDVEDDDGLARRLAESLKYFPRLKQCHLRLAKTPNYAIREICQDAVMEARGFLPPSTLHNTQGAGSSTPKKTGLLDLPRELRLHIFEFTDLITPMKEVMWSRAHLKYVASRSYCPSWEGRGDHEWPAGHHWCCQFNRCWERSYPYKTLGCFCGSVHSAFSSTCRCWAPPTRLFLICRTLHRDANLVFFSENRFAVMEGEAISVYSPIPWSGLEKRGCLAASQFLRRVVPLDCLGHLRFLYLVFPPFYPGQWPAKGSAVYQDWLATVIWAKRRLNLAALTIHVCATYRGDMDDYEPSARFTMADAEAVLVAYQEILQPLTHLGGNLGLAGFDADLSWPWSRIPVLPTSYDAEEERLRQFDSKDKSLNDQALIQVLGEDRYYARLPPRFDEYDGPINDGAWRDIFARHC
ncbi:hypothetical protein B0J18DRAFT_414650 [Chaetomium sp. MPI-SDFR-AT-0129]|nr:hypothetical protein B0J18DRAFT_414650 [Chaetomium sp. MPI-SDFR-AT-0129]